MSYANSVPSSYPSNLTLAPTSTRPNGSVAVRNRGEGESTASSEFSGRDLENSRRCAFRVAFRITRVKEDAEDVQQEALLKAYTHLGEFEGRSRLTTWISRIAINEALMCLRKRRDSIHVPLDDVTNPDEAAPIKLKLSSPMESPEAAYSRTELREMLKYALGQLRPIYRDVFTMRVLQSLSTTETAQMGRISVSTVKTRMRRARMQLREILRRERNEHLIPSRA